LLLRFTNCKWKLANGDVLHVQRWQGRALTEATP
jgi:hypothetical protein